MTEKTKKVSYIIIFSFLIIFFVFLLILFSDSSKIKEIDEFIKTDTKILHLSSDIKDTYINKVLKKYDVDFFEVDISKLSVFEIKKIKRNLDIEELENTIVVYENGKVIRSLKNYKTEKQIQKFFQKNNIIPKKIVSNIDEIKKQINNILVEDYAMIYIPYIEHERLEEQEQTLKSIASKYSIEYKKIDAYYLSNKQQEKMNSLLEISLVEDQIILLVKENKIVANIRGIHSKNTYIENLYEINFISELEDKINKIDYYKYKELLKDSNKNILFIGSSNIKDSNSIYSILNKMAYNFDINVNYLEIDKDNTYLYSKVQEKIQNIGYEGAFSLPMVLIVESNNILDYVIGNSTEEYFLDIFIENGVIKGDVINE